MEVVAVCVSGLKIVIHSGKPVETGIYKTPVRGPIMVRTLGLEGDRQADLKHHGGESKAVYAYPVEHYPFWQDRLGGESLPYGSFGENLSVRGLLESDVCIGDAYRVGSAVLEVTQPRVPCFKLDMCMGRPGVVRQFLHSGLTGFYFRVLQEGSIEAGTTIERLQRRPQALSVSAMHRLRHFERDNLSLVRRALENPALSPSWRDELNEFNRD